MKIFLDDCRPCPEGWTLALTAGEAIALLEQGNVEEISLDHDLGDEEVCGSGYQVATWIEEKAFHGAISPLKWRIHSANPVGVQKMSAALKSALFPSFCIAPLKATSSLRRSSRMPAGIGM